MKLNDFDKFSKQFSTEALWKKFKGFAQLIGTKTTYTVLLLFYTFEKKETPKWAKRVILGALGYFVSPIDAIPDLTPLLGYTDDIGVLALGLVAIAGHVNMDVRIKARKKIKELFGSVNLKDLEEIDAKF